MKTEIDVLILYADRDNKIDTHEEAGWVDQFRRFLELMLAQVLREKPNIIIKSDTDTITAPKPDNSAVLVTILTKDFIQSGVCLDYMEAFVGNTSPASGINRLFKVLKAPISVHEQPPRLRDLIGYEMYQLDPDSGELRAYADYFSAEAERQYWMKMVDLAYDIYDSLMALKGTPPERAGKSLYRRKTIYLAETGHDLSVQRNIIKRELLRHGYVVLPQATLPGNLAELDQVISRDLSASDLSIHLIGAAYGEIPEGTDKSVVEIQNKHAAARSLEFRDEQSSFSRLIWISPALNNASEKQKSFIERIKRDTEAQEGAEILQTPLEDFKNIMREELIDAGDRKLSTQENQPQLYLVFDKTDQFAVSPVIEIVKECGYQVLLPEFEGDLLSLRRKHIDNLRSFDVALIFKGKVNEQWVRMKILDLLKAPGFGRKKPIAGKALLAGNNPGLTFDAARQQHLRIIDLDQQESMKRLKDFLEETKVKS